MQIRHGEGKCNCSLNHVDRQLAKEVANMIGAPLPKENHEINSDAKSPALSMSNTILKLIPKCSNSIEW